MPWRETKDPYRILVSEIMLQQTQVVRVEEKYPKFIRAFPDFKALNRAPLAKVYGVWQGMGYNRRALALKKIAHIVVNDYKGTLPKTHEDLCALPGIGKATASSIMAFAFNRPAVFIETNIRTVFIHFFFKKRKQVADEEILLLVEQCLYRKNPRVWYWALMDYGTMLKKSGEDKNIRSKHYKKQGRFEGSRRQKRGKILKILLDCNGLNIKEMCDRMEVVNEGKKIVKNGKLKVESEDKDRAKMGEIKVIMEELIKEGMVREEKGRYFL
jgi:A/G-specific adenine glycosylase